MLDAHKQENVLYQIRGVLWGFRIEWNVDRYSVNTSNSGLVHEGERWFYDAGKIIIVYFFRIIPTQAYTLCQIAVFIGVAAVGTYCCPWALLGTVHVF